MPLAMKVSPAGFSEIGSKKTKKILQPDLFSVASVREAVDTNKY